MRTSNRPQNSAAGSDDGRSDDGRSGGGRKDGRRRGRVDRRGDRLARTVLLGTVAVVVGIYWMSAELRLDRAELLDFFLTSALFLAVVVAAAAVAGALLWLIKQLRDRGGKS
jgi:hypothetical protein